MGLHRGEAGSSALNEPGVAEMGVGDEEGCHAFFTKM
jgi:hypothetical protein